MQQQFIFSYLADSEGYVPADQLFVTWRLLSSWLFRCPFQLFLQPAEAQEKAYLKVSLKGKKRLEISGESYTLKKIAVEQVLLFTTLQIITKKSRSFNVNLHRFFVETCR